MAFEGQNTDPTVRPAWRNYITFSAANNLKFQELLSDDEWVAKLAYLADVNFLLNELNKSLQGQLKDVFTVRRKIDAFRKKISLRQTRLAEGHRQKFINFNEYMGEKDLNRHLVSIIQQHLQFFFIAQMKKIHGI